MLLFSTVLSISEKMTKDVFIRLAIKWNQGSRYPENIIPGIEWHGERNIRYGDDKVWMQIEEYRNQNIIAIRYEKTEEDGVIWDTDFIMNFSEMRMSVRLDRSYLEDAMTIYTTFSTPAFIALLIDGGYVKDDNGLPVGRKPVAINDENLSLITDVMNGLTHYNMPVVYISKTYDERNPVNVKEVAKRLKGVAHVFYQEHSWSEPMLRRLSNKNNEYDGAIGLYFPNPAVGHERLLNHTYPGSGKIMTEKVVQRVIQYVNVQRPDTLYTWYGVSNALLRDKYSSKSEKLAEAESSRRLYEIMAKASAYRAESADRKSVEMQKEAEEAKELVELVDAEMTQMRQQIEELTRQNDFLSSKAEALNAQFQTKKENEVPLLFYGSEEEMFEGEIKEFVLEILESELKHRIQPKTRRADVIGDILRSNGGAEGMFAEKQKRVKDIFSAFSDMTAPVKSALKDLGIKVDTEKKKHYKLTYHGDERYMITVSSTPGDLSRGGKNLASEINNKMF